MKLTLIETDSFPLSSPLFYSISKQSLGAIGMHLDILLEFGVKEEYEEKDVPVL